MKKNYLLIRGKIKEKTTFFDIRKTAERIAENLEYGQGARHWEPGDGCPPERMILLTSEVMQEIESQVIVQYCLTPASVGYSKME